MKKSSSGPWKKKRALKSKMDKIREVKRMKRSENDDVSLQQSNEDDLRTINEPSSLNDSLEMHLNAQNISEDDSSEDDYGFDPQQSYKEWVQKQPRDNLKVLAVMLMDTFIDRFGLTSVAAAKESGLLFNLNEKTVRTWRRDFYDNNGVFTETRQGKTVDKRQHNGYVATLQLKASLT